MRYYLSYFLYIIGGSTSRRTGGVVTPRVAVCLLYCATWLDLLFYFCMCGVQGCQNSLRVIERFDAVSGEYEVCLSKPFQTSLVEQRPTCVYYACEVFIWGNCFIPGFFLGGGGGWGFMTVSCESSFVKLPKKLNINGCGTYVGIFQHNSQYSSYSCLLKGWERLVFEESCVLRRILLLGYTTVFGR